MGGWVGWVGVACVRVYGYTFYYMNRSHSTLTLLTEPSNFNSN